MRWTIALLFFSTVLCAQMPVGTDTLYGNEWINYNKTYLKIKVAREGIFRLTYAYLQESGLPVEQIPGRQYQLWHLGKEQPLFVSNDEVFQSNDFVLFYGKPNESELDVFLFENGMDDMLNPGFSLVSDTAAYFLTWTSGSVKRFTPTENLPDILADPEPFYLHTLIQRVTNNFSKRPNGVGAMSRFSNGEGFSGSGTIDRNVDFNTPDVYSEGPPATLEVRMSTNNSRDHDLWYTFNGNEVDRLQFQNYRFLSNTYDIPATDLQATNRFRYERMGVAENRYFPAYFALNYPAAYTWNNFGFRRFEVAGTGEKKIVWENYNHNTAWVFDLTGHRLIQLPALSILEIGLEQTQTSVYALCHTNGFINPPTGELKQFERIQDIPGNYIMLYHPDIRLNSQGTDVLQEYIDYRNATGFEVMPVNVLELYDQYAYGVDRHFIALRNFAHYMHRQRKSIDHLFIIGKGREFRNLRTANQVNSASGSFFIPTFGAPGADQLIVCGNHDVDPIMGVGRIPVLNGDDLALYLEKVRAYETEQSYPVSEENRRWMKRVMHLSGGTGEAEREQLRQIMVRMGRRLEQGMLQVNLTAFAKLSSEPIEENVPSLIYDRINDGVSLISFLGHSGSTTIDFNIENFSRYNNRDKYFHFLALGCSVGNVHVIGTTLGERFVFLKDNGAISFLASSGLGYPSILENYGNRIYDRLSEERGLTLGQLFRDVHHDFRTTTNRFFQEQLEQMTINGDPGLRYNYPEGPDAAFDFTTARLTEGNVSVSMDSMTFEVDVLSLGTAVADSFSVLIVRQKPDGVQDSMAFHFFPERYRQKVSIRLPVGGETANGINSLFAEINHNRAIDEKPDPDAFSNNTLRSPDGREGFTFFVYGVSAAPSWPPDLAVIQDTRPELKAVTGNLFAEPATYIIELDTTLQFDSPAKLRHSFESPGGTILWTPETVLTDGRTYYWRISGDSIAPEAGYNWAVASFSIAANESAGLSMRHKDQFRPIENISFRQDSTLGWAFGQANRTLEIKNQVFVNNSSPSGSIEGFQFAGLFPWFTLHQGLLVVVIDPETGLLWRNPPGGIYGAMNTHPVWRIESFPYDVREKSQRESMINLLNDTIPDGQVVFIYSIQRTNQSSFAPEEWEADSLDFGGKNLFNILEAEGVSGIRNLKDAGSVPFILGYVKGQEVFEEKYAESITDVIDVVYSFLERLPEGQAVWSVPEAFAGIERATWQVKDSRFPEEDSIRIGFTATWPGSDPVQEQAINQKEGAFQWSRDGVPSDLSFSIRAHNNSRYAPQLSNWTLTGDWLPDLTLQKSPDELIPDTLRQGSAFRPAIRIVNLSGSGSDSTVLTYRIRSQNTIVQEDIIAIPPVPGESWIEANPDIATASLSGWCFLEVHVNPQGQLREIRLDNNFGVLPFYVEEDRINPLVDVYFDGMDIMDGDLVSARPEIRIYLRDENPYFPLDDTALFGLRLQYPSGNWRNLSFSADGMSFLPPADPTRENKAEVWMQREFPEDGTYLLEVTARDRAGNPSGQQPYRKRFAVVNKQMISSIVNYPNPFSTATRFVYTLTGSSSPDHFKVQIFTLSGQLVREISHWEMGPLRVGTHVTDYVWDGTDQYGQRLANGVYLYRLQTQNIEEEAVEHLDTRLDQFTTGGWSKMVILR
jgi:hypothetical protein